MTRKPKHKPALYLSLPSYQKTKKPKARRRIRPRSKKRTVLDREYAKLRTAFLTGKKCEVCEKPAEDAHHTKGRVKYYLAVDTWMAVCRGCHDNIHRNPALAYEKGYLKRRV